MNSLNDFDVSKFKLGTLCPSGHQYKDTNQSLRYISTKRCVVCTKDRGAKYRRKADKQKVSEYNKRYREANKESLAEYNRRYREANKDALIEKKKTRYEANKEKILNQQKEYTKKNKERIRQRLSDYYYSLTPEQKAKRNEYNRKRYAQKVEEERLRVARYRANNPAKRAETNRNYRHSNRHTQNVNNVKRRERVKQQSDGSITPEFLSLIFKEAKNCVYCGHKLVECQSLGRWEDVKTLDHITPLANGGGHTQDNVLVCCRQCNIKKGTKPFLEWAAGLEEPYRSMSLDTYESIRNLKSNKSKKKT